MRAVIGTRGASGMGHKFGLRMILGFASACIVLAATVAAQADVADCTHVDSFTTSPQYVPGDFVTSEGVVQLRSGDPVGPFPLATLVPFPWKSIEGIWTMKLPDGKSVFFSFEVKDSCDGRQFIKAQRFDSNSFKVMAEGVGLSLLNDTTVRAIMQSKTAQYMIYIRQFKQTATRARTTVVTIRAFGAGPEDDVHLVATRASVLTLEKYAQKTIEDRKARREAEARRRASAGRS